MTIFSANLTWLKVFPLELKAFKDNLQQLHQNSQEILDLNVNLI